MAMAFNTADISKEGASCDVIYLHKGKCDDEAQRQYRHSRGWEELSRHLLQLLYNSGLSLKKLEAYKEADGDLKGFFNYRPRRVIFDVAFVT